MGKLLRKGNQGDEVKELQTKLNTLGFDVDADGIFGKNTEAAVNQLQTLFGYTVDGIVGDGTRGLIDAQIGYGWNLKSPNAKERALASQGKGGGASTGPDAAAKALQAQKAADKAAPTNAKGQNKAPPPKR